MSFEKALEEFTKAIEENVIGALLVGRNGIVIASTFPADRDVDSLSKLSISISIMAEKLCKDLDRGFHEITIIEMESGYLLIAPISKEMLLIVLTSENPPLGLILLEIEGIKARIGCSIE